MRERFAGTRGHATLGVVLALAVFALYAVTTGQLVGYEDETAAVTEGLVKTGQLIVLPKTPLTNQGQPGRDGRLYSRTGITQPLLEAPFYALGLAMDELTASSSSYEWRDVILRFYDPFMAALTILAIFALLRLRGRRTDVALGVAGLAAVASMIWPYAKIGMDTTLMATFAVALVTAAWASRGGASRWLLAGIVGGAAGAAKPYGLVMLLALVPLLLEGFRRLNRGQQLRRAAALTVPIVLWLVVIGWYNWYRTGSVTNFDDQFDPAYLSTLINTLGLFVSPGRGLLLYSPLVILGLRGMKPVWRADRPLWWAIIAGVLTNTLVIAASSQWSDETWGPRYILPCAWLLLLPLAWWIHGVNRRRITAAVAAVGICVQIAGVFSPFGVSISLGGAYAGAPVYGYVAPRNGVSYGDDGPRWIPGASPLLFESEIVLAWTKEQLTGSGFTVSYSPLWGHQATFDLDHPATELGVTLPDFWWHFPGVSGPQKLLVALLALTGIGALALLVVSRGAWLTPTSRPALAGRAS